MKTITKLFLTVGLLAGSQGYTADLQTTRDAAHIGTAFMIQQVSYGFCKKALGFQGVEGLIFSALITATGTTLFEVLDADTSPRHQINTRGIGTNLLGIGLSVGASLVFEF